MDREIVFSSLVTTRHPSPLYGNTFHIRPVEPNVLAVTVLATMPTLPTSFDHSDGGDVEGKDIGSAKAEATELCTIVASVDNLRSLAKTLADVLARYD